jgi:MFS family permease
VHGSYVANLLGPDVIIGMGLGLAFVSITIASTLGVSNDRAGLAGGLINTTQQIGGAIGLAVITTVAVGHAGAVHTAANVDGGFRVALLVAAGIGAAATITTMWFPKRQGTLAEVGADGDNADQHDAGHQETATGLLSAPAVAA